MSTVNTPQQPPDPYRKGLLFFYVETPLHAGCGEGLGAVDLPIQRERMSHLPQVQASGIKGALRELFRGHPQELTLFGPKPPEPKNGGGSEAVNAAPTHAGALIVSDARLLLMPLRTVHGGWAWATSPLILERLRRDLGIAGIASGDWTIPAPPAGDQGIVLKENPAIAPNKGQLIIEDTLYTVTPADTAVSAGLRELLTRALADDPAYAPLRARIADQVVILSDDELRHWVRHGTEIATRVRIDPDTGTVEDGALWTEESLPSEAVLWSLALVSDGREPKATEGTNKDALFGALDHRLKATGRLFLGGDRTIGRGLCRLHLREAPPSSPRVQEKHHASR